MSDKAKTETTAPMIDALGLKRAELVEAQRSHAAGELVNPRVLRSLRKDIARELTARNAGVETSPVTETSKEGDA